MADRLRDYRRRLLRKVAPVPKTPAGIQSCEIVSNRYNFANLQRNEIRLLELLQHPSPPNVRLGGVQVPIQCRIRLASLDNPPPYDALSYSWGLPILDQGLEILTDDANGGQREVLYITKQLQNALLRVRDANEPRLLWVDQICINQDDLDERSSQVLLMRQIYQHARKTVVWLGEPEDKHDAAVIGELADFLRASTLCHEERVKGLPEMLKTYPNCHNLPPFRLGLVQHIQDRKLLKSWIDLKNADTISMQRRQAITNLFNQDWFNRAWIVQEVLVSLEVEIMYGPTCTSIEVLERIAYTVQDFENEALGWRQALHNTTKGYQDFKSLTFYKTHFDYAGCADKSFLLFMSRMQARKSTDPRDKVYAFLGLKMPINAPNIIPNYRKSVAEVYADTALSFIEESKSLMVLGLVEGNENLNCCSSPVPNLPSWAPNWSQKFHGVGSIADGDITAPSSFRSARDIPHDPKATGPFLHVKGKIVATLRTAFPLDFDKMKPYWDGFRILLPISHIVQALKLNASEFEDLPSAVLRTLLADGAWSPEQPLKYSNSKILEVYNSQADIRRSDQIESEDYKVLEYLKGCSLVLQKRRIFDAVGADKVFLGLGNRFIQSGDLVCIFYGSQVPVVIRRHTSHFDLARGQYKVICQCYLDGWMYGDFPLDSWWEEFEQRPDMFMLV